MRKYTLKGKSGNVSRNVRELPSRAPRNVTPDDVLAALLELFGKLQIEPSDLASRVSSLDPKLLAAHRLYSHTAAVGELLTEWHQNPEYLDESGVPLPIKLRGRGSSFYKLARDSAPNLEPSTLLAELKRVGAVVLDKRRFVHVRMRSLPVYKDNRLAIQHTLMSLHSFIRTLRHNLDSDPSNTDQLFHRVAWNGAFDRKLVPTLKIKLKRQGQDFLESFDNWMMRTSKNRRGGARRRGSESVFIGVYLAVGDEPKKKALRLAT
jgi:Family of unknown function (DUF6502)